MQHSFPSSTAHPRPYSKTVITPNSRLRTSQPSPIYNTPDIHTHPSTPVLLYIPTLSSQRLILRMLQHFRIPGPPMPHREHDAAVAALMLHILGRVDQVGDAAAADRDEADEAPDTRVLRQSNIP